MTDDIDPGLSDLLKELSQAEGSIKPKEEELVAPEPEPASDVMTDVDDLEPATPDEQLSAHETEEPIKETKTEVVFTEDQSVTIKNSIQAKLLNLMDTAVNESVAFNQEIEVDRKKCDDIYNLLVPKIQAGDYSGADAVALVQIMQVKANISSNRSRHMDSISKLFVSLKSNSAVGSGDTGGSGGGDSDDGPSRSEITKLLNTPIDEE